VKANFLWGMLWVFGLVVAVLWRAQNLDAFGLSNDEGVYLMWGRLAADAYPLYGETYAVQPPLFFETLALAFRWFGATVVVGRLAMMSGLLLLAAGLSWLVYNSSRWPGAIAALILVAVSPLIFWLSRLAMAEVYASGLAVTSVALLLLYRQRQGRGWIVAAGASLSLSLLFKVLYPVAGVVAGLMLVLHHTNQPWSGEGSPSPLISQVRRLVSLRKAWRSLGFDLALFAAGLLAPVVLVLLWYDAGAFYNQVIAFRGDLRVAVPGSWPDTWSQFRLFFAGYWGFWLLAFAGIMFNELVRRSIVRQTALLTFINLIWLLFGMAMLVWHTPLFAHHFVILLPPLIFLAADFVGQVVWLWQTRTGVLPLRIASALVVGLALFNLPAMVQANQSAVSAVTGGREQEALQLLAAVSHPDDFIMGDSQLLIFMADRRTPPPLGDLALVGIKAGRQTSERLVEINQAYKSPAVVRWSLRLPWLPEYVAWAEANYLARRVWDNDHIIHFCATDRLNGAVA
jgi:hypothetical protein